MIKAVIMKPGRRAKEVKIEPTVSAMESLVGGSFIIHRPKDNGIGILTKLPEPGVLLNLNRIIVSPELKRTGVYRGVAYAIGLGRNVGEFRSLKKREIKEVMEDYGEPYFPDQHLYGLIPGEELKVTSKHKLHPLQEGEPERLVVVREYEHFIHVIAHVRYEDGEASSYPICINKVDLISSYGDRPLRVIRCRTGERLK